MSGTRPLAILYALSAVLTFVLWIKASEPIAILSVSLMLGTCYGFYVPIQRSLLPDFLPSVSILRANSRFQICDLTAKAAGFSLAGFSIEHNGVPFSFLVDSVSFIVISVYMARMNAVSRPLETTSFDVQQGRVDINKSLLLMSSMFAATWIGTGALFALEATYAKDYLRATNSVIGWLFGIATLGAFATTPIAAVVRKLSPIHGLAVVSFIELFMIIGYAHSNSLTIAFGFILIYGTALAVRHVLIASWIHETTAPGDRPTAFAFQQAFTNFGMLFGMTMSGFLANITGVRESILIFAIFGLSCLAFLLVKEYSPFARVFPS